MMSTYTITMTIEHDHAEFVDDLKLILETVAWDEGVKVVSTKVAEVNAYDADRARIAELEAQVKALAEACEAAEKYLAVTADVYVYQTGEYALMDILDASSTLIELNDAALAKVCGESDK